MTTRLGGLCGLVAVLAVIPGYVVGLPDTPETPAEAASYPGAASSFITANGVLPMLHILLGLVFLGVLVAVLRRAAGPDAAVYIAMIGGTLWLVLVAVGIAAEVAYPAAIVRFGDVTVAEFTRPVLRFCPPGFTTTASSELRLSSSRPRRSSGGPACFPSGARSAQSSGCWRYCASGSRCRRRWAH